ncbi:MAG: hypothetical protein AAGE98_17285 [Actinomycetota bacterium]
MLEETMMFKFDTTRSIGALRIAVALVVLCVASCASKVNEGERLTLRGLATDACEAWDGDVDGAMRRVLSSDLFPAASDAEDVASDEVRFACEAVERQLAKAELVSPECLAGFRYALSIDEMRDTVADFDSAMRSCATYEEWLIAAEETRADREIVPEPWPWNRCNSAEAPLDVRQGALCVEVIEGQLVGS